MNDFPFSITNFNESLSILSQNRAFMGRNEYVGSSEVGYCMRITVWNKLHPDKAVITDPYILAVMELGHAIEEINAKRWDAFLKHNKYGKLEHTGKDQLELKDPESPLVSHPDGIIKLDAPLPEGGWVLLQNSKPVIFNYNLFKNGMTLHGIYECKSTGADKLSSWNRFGLPIYYVDQVIVNMELYKSGWTLLTASDRNSLMNNTLFLIPSNEHRFKSLQDRARTIMEYVSRKELPEGEPHRAASCNRCPIADHCAMKGKRK